MLKIRVEVRISTTETKNAILQDPSQMRKYRTPRKGKNRPR
jgi:hypothetical protein